MTASNTAIDSASTAASNAANTMADRAHQAIDRAAEKAAPALDRVRSNVHNTVDKVADSAASGVGWAAENTTVLARRGTELTDVACAYVRERPIVAVAGALALGYFVGRLLR
jgi:ElaB/YqjD/DUF883 family membrane-anchored ribosome-binding protein